MPRWVGLLGSWALLVLGLGLVSFAAAGEVINIRDEQRLNRFALIDQMIRQRNNSSVERLKATAAARIAHVSALQSKVEGVAKQTDDAPATDQTIVVSTAENRLYVRKNGQTIFQAICSTGKGTRLAVDGHTTVFETPIGKFKIKSKDENPQWVPPDWHYVEEAHKNGMSVVHLNPGDAIDADSGQPAQTGASEGVWSWFGGSANNGSHRILQVKHGTVVVQENGVERELPPGKLITAGGAIIVPPVDSPQRHFDKVLGKYRLELGDGYGIHGTDEPDKLGQSVSHGCVRLGDSDIEKLYQIANVGDEVVIY
jgi:lipoprotein-anchoring transpeptidase ErfK/SrfK